MQWYNMYLSDAHLQASEGIVEIMFLILDAYGLNGAQKVHTVRMLRAFVRLNVTAASEIPFPWRIIKPLCLRIVLKN